MTAFARLAGTAGLALGLAGCIDATIDIEVLSETEARSTVTQSMEAEFYAMVQLGEEEAPEDAEAFCAFGELTENPDGSAVCVESEQGPFDSLAIAEEESGVRFSVVAPGQVRVALDTEGLAEEVGGDELDPETRQMMETFLTGHALTVRISGTSIIETNMDEVEGGAQLVIPFVDLLRGIDLPDELYAVVSVE